MNETKYTPVLLLTGYLGSGKTTLLNRILANNQGIKFAVIVNDLGTVNIDASLIEKGGIVGKKNESLVALQNGCICSTLKMDLVEQLNEITRQNRFDYIVIEASGICEPAPIAQTISTIPQLGPQYANGNNYAKLDCIATVVDALRMQSEFSCGDTLPLRNYDEEDLESLVVQQIEFCNLVLLNKASMVKPDELARVHSVIHKLNPGAEILECDFCDVPFEKLLNTDLFDFDKVATSAAWIAAIEGEEEELHNEEEGEADEYGVGTFVWYRREPMDMNKFDWWVAKCWPRSVIRSKGLCYFSKQMDNCYLFEQSGVQKSLKDAGLWFATMPKDQLAELMLHDKALQRDWDPKWGDRMQKIVFIGQDMDRAEIEAGLDSCLVR